MQNLGYLFNKGYYKHLGTPDCEMDVRRINKQIEATRFEESDYLLSPLKEADSFKNVIMQIGAPGLLICMGNPHGIGTKDMNWNIAGFFIDNKYDRALKFALNEVLALGFSEDEIEQTITDEQISRAKECLLSNRTSSVRFLNANGRRVDFNPDDQLEKLKKTLQNYCINSNSEIKNGFSFDYTSGQPYIPGSSVKGMLRSIFKEHRDAAVEILKLKTNLKWTKDEVKELESDIFDNNDVFLDAVLYWGDKYGNILSTDFITPHKSPIKNPVPIRILKINPGVKLEFRFILHDHQVNNKTLAKDKLLEIFVELLELFGLGAKTNVGYGILVKSNDERPQYSVRNQNPPSQQNQNVQQRGNNRGNNRYQGNNRDNGGNSNSRVNAPAGPEKIRCPHCGKLTYKYALDGITLNTNCKNPDCRKPLN